MAENNNDKQEKIDILKENETKVNVEKTNENSKVDNNSESTNKSNKTIFTAIIILILLIAIILSGFAYAKYVTSKEASATAQVAQLICEMEVQSSEADDTIINPYCTVTVKNYNSEEKITETDVNFKIEVTPKGDFVLPEYYWKDSTGTILAQSTEVSGSFQNGVKDLKEYTIVFLNSGEEDVVRNVDFNLVAIQVGK